MNRLSVQIDKAIRAAIVDAKNKGKLGLVKAISSIPESRLEAIIAGAEMTLIERTMLKVHIQLPGKAS